MSNKPEITPEYQFHLDTLKAIKPVKAWLTYFEPVLNNWQPAWGKPPTAQQLTAGVALAAKRHGHPGVECYCIALHVRAEGCQKGKPTVYTNSAMATNLKGDNTMVGAANNKIGSCVGAGWLTEVNVGGKQVRLEITKAGAEHIARYLGQQTDLQAAQATNAKVAAKVAAKKAKPHKAPTVTADEPEVDQATTLPEPTENAPVSPVGPPEAIQAAVVPQAEVILDLTDEAVS